MRNTFYFSIIFISFKFAAYLSRNDYNIFTIDWSTITRFPCYVSALSNTRLVAQCTAMLYAFIMENGGDARKTTCIGHSLGAHICGMMSNHLDKKQHKIVGKLQYTSLYIFSYRVRFCV